jgi:hypothetical protein
MSDMPPPDDDFRRDRDPHARRNARIAGALVALVLAALVVGLAVTRNQPRAIDPAARVSPSPSSARPTPPSLSPTPVPLQAVLGFSFSAAYDERSHQLVTFGGVDSYDDTWLWDGQHWTLARPQVSPPGRFGAASAYDPLTGVVMLYGGRLGPGEVVDDTWAWDRGTWRELDGGVGNPPGGEGSVMAWDDTHRQMVLVSTQAGLARQTWTWNGSRWVEQSQGALPQGVAALGIAVDPVTHALLAVLCCDPSGGTTSTYTWDGAAWHRVTTHTTPAFTVGLVRDPLSARLLMFGDPSVVPGKQLWSWSGRDWTLVAGARLPVFPTRAVTDTDLGQVVIVGSAVEPVQGNPQPMQVWSLNGTAWRQLG